MNVIECCREIARFTETPGQITRTFLSEPMRGVHKMLGDRMRALGMGVWVDAAGNLRGLYGDPNARRLIVASHLDTVPNAGAFDGILGVAMGVALAESKPPLALEVIGFSEEEGVRFGMPFIGSRALVGTLDRDDAVWQAIRDFGLDPDEMPNARFAPQTVGCLEFHIEQGPVLESMNEPLGIVDAIAGQSRMLLTFTGKANHAGTTPMTMRQDALAAAAEWVLQVETMGRQTGGLVATVGLLDVLPNAGNVIPGEVRASLDVRHASDAVRKEAMRNLLAAAQAMCSARRIELKAETRLDQAAVGMTLDPGDRSLPRLTSGAGHDAMIIAPHIPTAMVFLRSPGGISHHPDESVLEADVEAALGFGRKLCMTL